MSSETRTWLASNVLVGYTEKRGHAWHYKAGDDNHYEGAIPVEAVRDRLFHWHAVEASLKAEAITEDGVLSVTDPTRKVIVRPDTGAVFGVFKSGYQVHQFDEWLIDEVGNLLEDDLRIGSAGLLKGGAVAWVSIEVPDNITTPEGVEFRPHLVAATSHDGTLATTYKRSITLPVCDNTLAASLGERHAQSVKIRHSRYSALKLASARDALGIVYDLADSFSAQVAELCATTVTDKQWSRFLDSLIAIPSEDGRGRTLATNKREILDRMYRYDSRVAPWQGTAFGVIQAVNTADHHAWNAKGDRVERNMLKSVSGGFDALDADTLATLTKVLV